MRLARRHHHDMGKEDWMNDLIDLMQWPAMVVSVLAAYLVASLSKHKRNWGFWLFLLSNALWIVWGLHTSAWALIVLQVSLAALNIRGVMKNGPQGQDAKKAA
jgi:hypothetical protein